MQPTREGEVQDEELYPCRAAGERGWWGKEGAGRIEAGSPYCFLRERISRRIDPKPQAPALTAQGLFDIVLPRVSLVREALQTCGR